MSETINVGHFNYEVGYRQLAAELARVQAENERLRAALEELRARGCPVDSRIARIALQEGDTDERV